MGKLKTSALVLVAPLSVLGAMPQARYGQGPSVSVTVLNPATNPVRTRDVENRARLRYQTGGGFIDFAQGDFEIVADGPTVPAGKVCVVEFLTAYAAL